MEEQNLRENKVSMLLGLLAIVLVVVAVGYYAPTISNKQTANVSDSVKIADDIIAEEIANCLSEKGAKFYGAYWCPHCQNQKLAFGKSASKLPYIECSVPGQKGQERVCTEAGVTSYPTWIFADGTRLVGEIPLNELSEKAMCQSK